MNEITDAQVVAATRADIREMFVETMVSEMLAHESRAADGQLVSLTPEYKAQIVETTGAMFDKACPAPVEVSESKWIHAMLPHVCRCREAFGHLVDCHLAAQSAYREFVRAGLLPVDPLSL